VAHQGVAAWAPPLELRSLADLAADPSLLSLALDSIQDPQNFGAVIRSAVGVADASVLWGEHGSAPLSLATFRASAGAIEHARLVRVRSLHHALAELGEHGARVVGLDASAPEPLRAIDLTGPTVLVIGSEHEGLARNVRRTCTVFAHLIAPHRIASLNASVAAAIALYEATIQRMKSAG
jgi:23S rRNA (guanosine2251-2'-O)-methyltransferase